MQSPFASPAPSFASSTASSSKKARPSASRSSLADLSNVAPYSASSSSAHGLSKPQRKERLSLSSTASSGSLGSLFGGNGGGISSNSSSLTSSSSTSSSSGASAATVIIPRNKRHTISGASGSSSSLLLLGNDVPASAAAPEPAPEPLALAPATASDDVEDTLPPLGSPGSPPASKSHPAPSADAGQSGALLSSVQKRRQSRRSSVAPAAPSALLVSASAPFPAPSPGVPSLGGGASPAAFGGDFAEAPDRRRMTCDGTDVKDLLSCLLASGTPGRAAEGGGSLPPTPSSAVFGGGGAKARGAKKSGDERRQTADGDDLMQLMNDLAADAEEEEDSDYSSSLNESGVDTDKDSTAATDSFANTGVDENSTADLTQNDTTTSMLTSSFFHDLDADEGAPLASDEPPAKRCGGVKSKKRQSTGGIGVQAANFVFGPSSASGATDASVQSKSEGKRSRMSLPVCGSGPLLPLSEIVASVPAAQAPAPPTPAAAGKAPVQPKPSALRTSSRLSATSSLAHAAEPRGLSAALPATSGTTAKKSSKRKSLEAGGGSVRFGSPMAASYNAHEPSASALTPMPTHEAKKIYQMPASEGSSVGSCGSSFDFENDGDGDTMDEDMRKRDFGGFNAGNDSRIMDESIDRGEIDLTLDGSINAGNTGDENTFELEGDINALLKNTVNGKGINTSVDQDDEDETIQLEGDIGDLLRRVDTSGVDSPGQVSACRILDMERMSRERIARTRGYSPAAAATGRGLPFNIHCSSTSSPAGSEEQDTDIDSEEDHTVELEGDMSSLLGMLVAEPAAAPPTRAATVIPRKAGFVDDKENVFNGFRAFNSAEVTDFANVKLALNLDSTVVDAHSMVMAEAAGGPAAAAVNEIFSAALAEVELKDLETRAGGSKVLEALQNAHPELVRQVQSVVRDDAVRGGWKESGMGVLLREVGQLVKAKVISEWVGWENQVTTAIIDLISCKKSDVSDAIAECDNKFLILDEIEKMLEEAKAAAARKERRDVYEQRRAAVEEAEAELRDLEFSIVQATRAAEEAHQMATKARSIVDDFSKSASKRTELAAAEKDSKACERKFKMLEGVLIWSPATVDSSLISASFGGQMPETAVFLNFDLTGDDGITCMMGINPSASFVKKGKPIYSTDARMFAKSKIATLIASIRRDHATVAGEDIPRIVQAVEWKIGRIEMMAREVSFLQEAHDITLEEKEGAHFISVDFTSIAQKAKTRMTLRMGQDYPFNTMQINFTALIGAVDIEAMKRSVRGEVPRYGQLQRLCDRAAAFLN